MGADAREGAGVGRCGGTAVVGVGVGALVVVVGGVVVVVVVVVGVGVGVVGDGVGDSVGVEVGEGVGGGCRRASWRSSSKQSAYSIPRIEAGTSLPSSCTRHQQRLRFDLAARLVGGWAGLPP